jgi:ATP-dependent protease ClpP protease subunit
MFKKLALCLLAIVFLTTPVLADDLSKYSIPLVLSEPDLDEKDGRCTNTLNGEDGIELSIMSFVTDDVAYMFLYSGISTIDYKRILEDLTILKDCTDIRNIKFLLNSPGGDAFQGMSISDVILTARNKWDFNIEVHATGIIASAAVPIFASCYPRYATSGTIFMVHEAAIWKWPGRESKSDLESQNKMMELLQERYIDYLPTTELTREEWTDKIKETTWFCATDAKEIGLVDEIE